MFDVSLYGNITFDRIINKDFRDNSVGSIGNVWKHLNYINPKLKINLQPTDFGEALILINEDTAERASTTNMSLYNRKPQIQESKWNHITYLNQIQDLSFISKINTGVISADICRGSHLSDVDVLKEINYLFLADEDIFMDIKKLISLVKNGLILHHKGGSICYMKDGSKFESKVNVIENINVLGCGDMFASYVINHYLTSNNLKESIKTSHKLVTDFLEATI